MQDSKKGRAAVIGNGLMGVGIAQIFVMAGWDVVMIGRNQDRLTQARENVATGLRQFSDRAAITAADAKAALERLTLSTELKDAAGSDIVIEAVTEDIPLKRRIFADLDRICAPDCILASSSGQPASALTEGVTHVERVVAAHFWFPAPLIPVVEVCPSPKTDPDVVRRTMEILRAVGKDPVEMKKELPGMIGNRIQFAILREAWALWASGAADAEAIDTVVKKTLGRRLGITGPLESAELGGLATLHSFAESLLPHIDARPAPDPKVSALVREGGGTKSTHDWSKRDGDALRGARVDELFRWLDKDAAGKS